MSEKICAYCGQAIEVGDAFCPSCGTRVVSPRPRVVANPVALPTDRPPSAPVVPAKRGVAGRIVLGIVAALIVIGVGVITYGATKARAEKHTVTGELVLYDDNLDTAKANGTTYCGGKGGYADIQAGVRLIDEVIGGSQVRIADQSGTLLSTGALEGGQLWGTNVCHFTFAVADVPDADFYQIEVSHRGGLSYSKADMERLGWAVSFTLGQSA